VGAAPADRFVEARACAGGAADVTIVLPVFEQERFVADALGSVLAQRGVVAEVVVSDDASTDGTWARVEEVAAAYDGPHGIVLRQGSARLRRDHTALLVERASCDTVVIAHGDDLSVPDRAATLRAVLDDSGAAVAGSRLRTIGTDDGPDVLAAPAPAPVAGAAWSRVDAVDLVSFRSEFTGAALALRRSKLAPFPRLDAARAACGHDWVLPFRGALAGGAVVVDEELVARRLHDRNWSKGIWDVRRPESVEFGQALFGLSVLGPMSADLEVAVAHGLVDPDEAARLRGAIEDARGTRTEALVGAHDRLVRDGRSVLWVTDDEAALAAAGDLWARYAWAATARDRLRGLRAQARDAQRRLRGQRR